MKQIEYDPAFRPIRQTLRDGTRVQWGRDGNDATRIIATLSGGEEITAIEREEGRRRELHFPGDRCCGLPTMLLAG